jgi:lipoprotein-anchoring transpeptidase ErfK/SrfK
LSSSEETVGRKRYDISGQVERRERTLSHKGPLPEMRQLQSAPLMRGEEKEYTEDWWCHQRVRQSQDMKRSAGFIMGILTLLLLGSAGVAKEKIKSLCDIHYPSDQRIAWSCRKLTPKDTPQGLFGAHWLDVLHFNRMDRRHFFGGVSIKVPRHIQQINSFTPLPSSYPAAAGEPKLILIDQSEMYLGAYQYGKLVYSFPIALGSQGYQVPDGSYQIDAADKKHHSNQYSVEEVGRPYPMHYALRFWVDKSKEEWPSYWIHGRDVPGYPASHGCIGLYDEEMQNEYYRAHDKKVYKNNYHPLTEPLLRDARVLYEWVVDRRGDPGTFHLVKNGPKVIITGKPPQLPS